MEQATPKQIEFAKKLGIENPEKYDKQALRGLIDVKVKEQGGNQEKTYQGASKQEFKQSKGYHLTPEQVKTNALMAALIWYPTIPNGIDEIKVFWECVHEFHKYLSS
jgi:hypothetical protein